MNTFLLVYCDANDDTTMQKVLELALQANAVAYSYHGLKNAVGEIKPAYIPYEWKFKYLLIKDIHEVMTIDEMENTLLNDFSYEIGD